MDAVGIRELKAPPSRHLKRVRSGARLTVTERGRSIATITPVEAPVDVRWARRLIAEGRANWSGANPPEARDQLASPVRGPFPRRFSRTAGDALSGYQQPGEAIRYRGR